MRFDKEENYENITNVIIEYCNSFLIPSITQDIYKVKIEYSKSLKFNARVETVDGIDFKIILNYGIAASFIEVINLLENKDIDEEIEILSEQIFNNKDLKTDIYRSITFGAIFFVVLHELSHILKQHLHYILKSNPALTSLCFNEINDPFIIIEQFYSESFFKDNIHKLFELDADAFSIILIMALSTELYGHTSNLYDVTYPNWRNEAENSQHRLATNQIMLYSTCLALAAIEAQRGPSEKYPKPFTRILNIYDAFNQEIYKTQNIIDADTYPSVSYLKLNDSIKNVMDKIVFPTFINSVDIIFESCMIMKYNLTEKYNILDGNLSMNLLYDFIKLLKDLSPSDLRTQEAEEFKMLRLYKPKFNEIFTHFLK